MAGRTSLRATGSMRLDVKTKRLDVKIKFRLVLPDREWVQSERRAENPGIRKEENEIRLDS